jgi:hypothetical protein
VTGSLLERVWTIAAIVCLFIAALFLFRENYNAAFVAATLGAVAWFMNYRNQLRSNIIEPEETDEMDEDDFEDEDEK